jgi:hypothetical protein
MKPFVKILLPILILSISFFACKKSVENRLEGHWRLVNLENPYADEVEEWHFTGHYIYFLKIHVNAAVTDTLGWCSYKVKANPLRKKVVIENNTWKNSQYADLTEFGIHKLTSKYLILVNDEKGGLIYNEFTKK